MNPSELVAILRGVWSSVTDPDRTLWSRRDEAMRRLRVWRRIQKDKRCPPSE